jgi:hypothetical protein
MSDEAKPPKGDDEFFIDWENHVFGFGYGTGEEHVISALRQFFTLLRDGRSYWYEDLEAALTPTVAWLMINVLCHADVIEYGTSPRGGWLTSSGQALAQYMKSKSVEELLELEIDPPEYIHCYPDRCNCAAHHRPAPCDNPFWRED